MGAERSFIRYHPPGGSGSGSGDCDPAQFSSPGGDIVVGGIVGACTLDLDSSTVSHFASGAGTVPANGTLGDSYFETDLALPSWYAATNTPVTAVVLAGADATPTDDSVVVGSGTAWAKKVVGDCDDTGGNHLNYDTTTNAWTCGTSSGSAGPTSPDNTDITVFDDFTSSNVPNWFGVAAGVGTYVHYVSDGVERGVLRMNSHASNDNSGWTFNFGSHVSFDTLQTVDFDISVWIIPGANSTSIATAAFVFGIARLDMMSASQSGFLGIRWDSDRTDTTYMVQSCQAAGATGCQAAGDDTNSKTVASTQTPVAGTKNKLTLRHRVSGVGGAETFYLGVGAEAEKTLCSSGCDDTFFDLTTNAISIGFAYGTRNTTGVVSGNLDAVLIKYVSLAR